MENGNPVYRVRMRKKGTSEIIAENVDLEMAYKIVEKRGGNTSKHFAIDKVIYEPFSVLTSREAKIRLEKGEY